MKKEFEAFRSKLYAYIFLILALVCVAVGFTFLLMWIEVSVPIIIISLVLFIAFMVLFMLFFLKNAPAVELKSKEIVFYAGEIKRFDIADVKKIYVLATKQSLKIELYTDEEEYEFSSFVASARLKAEELIALLKKLNVSVNEIEEENESKPQ